MRRIMTDDPAKVSFFSDPAEVRRLLESIGAGGAIAVAVDCGLANPRTLPAITELVAGGCIAVTGRETVVADIYRLTQKGAALTRAAGIDPAVSREENLAPAGSAEKDCHAAIEALAAKFFAIIASHYQSKTSSRSNVTDVLNALACVAGTVIAGTKGAAPENDTDALGFFRAALDQQIAVLTLEADE